MARLARGKYLHPQTVQIVHTVHRCVRRAFLCGHDPVTGKSHEHRRQWIRNRLEFLASVFGIDCLTYAVLSNHLHLVLRSRPDVVRSWSDEEVARRWLRLFPERHTAGGDPAKPNKGELQAITGDPRRLAELRIRLSDISWWARCTAENIGRAANREDGCTGHFWEGRYKAQLILDEPSLLACAMYVDLNPIRAALAQTPEESTYTGARERIDDLKQGFFSSSSSPSSRTKCKKKKQDKPTRPTHDWERSRRRLCSGWLSPVEINEKSDPAGANVSHCGRRASLKGFLSISLTRYLDLLDWTGRQLRSDKRGSIPSQLAPILERLGIDSRGWCDLVSKFGRLFKRAAGSPESLSREAARRGNSWMQGPGCDWLRAG